MNKSTLLAEITTLETNRLDWLNGHKALVSEIVTACQLRGQLPSPKINATRHPNLREWKVAGLVIYSDEGTKGWNPVTQDWLRRSWLNVTLNGLTVCQASIWNDGRTWGEVERFIPGAWIDLLLPELEKVRAELDALEVAALARRRDELKEMLLIGKDV